MEGKLKERRVAFEKGVEKWAAEKVRESCRRGVPPGGYHTNMIARTSRRIRLSRTSGLQLLVLLGPLWPLYSLLEVALSLGRNRILADVIFSPLLQAAAPAAAATISNV